REIVEIAAEMVVGRQIKRLGLFTRMADDRTPLAYARRPAILAENRDPPRERRLHRRGQRSRCAVLEFNKRGCRVAGVELDHARLQQATDALHRPDHVTKAIEPVDAHAGHAAGAAFFLAKAPTVGRIVREPVMAVVAFRMHDRAKGTLLLEVGEKAHRWHQPEMMADGDHDAGAPTGVERGLRIGFVERERLFAINMLAGSRNGFDLLAMFGVRCCEDYRLD